MGSYPSTAEQFRDVEHSSQGSIVDSWVTAYHYEGEGGQVLRSKYRKKFKVAKIYASSGRMFGFKKDGSSIKCKMDISSTGRNTQNILILGKKWIKISEFEASIGKAKKTIDILENEFEEKAYEFCSKTKKFKILKKNIEIIEYDETPAIGLEPVVKLVIDGTIECK